MDESSELLRRQYFQLLIIFRFFTLIKTVPKSDIAIITVKIAIDENSGTLSDEVDVFEGDGDEFVIADETEVGSVGLMVGEGVEVD